MAKKIGACPVCGSGIIMRGRSFKLGTPRAIVLLRSIFRHGITCVECGCYRPTVKAWNEDSEFCNDLRKLVDAVVIERKRSL